MADNGKRLGDLVDPTQIENARLEVARERELRRRISVQYAGLFDSATSLFFAVDPAGINFESNADEYEPEVGTVLPRLESANSVKDVEQILREEFQRWFGDAFDGRSIDGLAPDLWALWQEWKSSRGQPDTSAPG